MKFARLAAAPLLTLTFCIAQACSDPPSPPAQAAVTLKIGVTPGKACTHTHNVLSMPSAENTGVLTELTGCDLSVGCKPDEYLVVDRDRGANVTCQVSQVGSNFNISVTLTVDGTASGTPSMQFQANGTVNATGGTLSVNEEDSQAGGGGQDGACMVTITPNFGVVGKGKIWAQFVCTNFVDPTDLSSTGCTVQGAFLFENCSG